MDGQHKALWTILGSMACFTTFIILQYFFVVLDANIGASWNAPIALAKTVFIYLILILGIVLLFLSPIYATRK